MSVARGFGLNGAKFFTNVVTPKQVSVNFVIDSTNGNGVGVRSIKSNGYVESVVMSSSGAAPAGTPALGTARTYSILAASAITNTGNTAITGNIGEFPGTALTPGSGTFTVSGQTNIANVAAQQAKASAQAAYTALQALTPATIATALDAQTLVPGTYKAASGTFTLAASAGGTLTLNGLGVYVFQMTTTLTTGAGGVPVIALTGGARAQDVYFVVGSTATINSGNAGTFNGNIIAQTSITNTSGGTVNGSLVALTGAVTLSAGTTMVALPQVSIPAGPLPGFCWVQFKNNFNKYLGGFSGQVSPVSGTPVSIAPANLVVGQAYIIVSLGTSTLADWQAVGLPQGFTPAVGQAFLASSTGHGAGSGAVETPSVSGVNSVEVVGDPNTTLNNASIAANAGARILLQFLSNGVPSAPADGSVVGMTFLFDGSSVSIDGL